MKKRFVLADIASYPLTNLVNSYRVFLSTTRAMAYRRGILMLCVVATIPFPGIAQEAPDVPFNPRYDGVEVPLDSRGHPVVGERRDEVPIPTHRSIHSEGESSKQKIKHIYSFSRFSADFKEICLLVGLDGRRERLYSVAVKGVGEEQGCPTCRAFLKQIVASCYVKVRPPVGGTLKKETPEKEIVKADTSAVAEATLGANSEVAPEPSDIGRVDNISAGLSRFPSTELVDRLSRLSVALYEFGPGSGAVFDALKSFERHLLLGEDLTPGERDYFEVFFSYIISAWSGRPGSPLDGRTPSPQELQEMFGG